MIGPEKTELFANVRKDIKERIDALKEVDKVLYSNSRVVAECLEAHLHVVEQRVQHSFRKPSRTRPHRAQRVGV